MNTSIFAAPTRSVILALLLLLAGSGAAIAQPGQRPSTRQWHCGFGVNGAYHATSTAFGNSLALPLYGESKVIATTYSVPAAPAFDTSFHCEGPRKLGFGVGVTYYDKAGTGTINGNLPHPFFFNQARTVNGTVGIRRSETALNFDAVWATPLNDRVRVLLFGGPSLFSVTQTLVNDISVVDNYPFDQAAFSSAATAQQTKSSIGLNTGVDVTYMLTGTVGLGGLIEYLHARATLPTADGRTVGTNSGGVQVGAGVRFRF